MQEKLLTLLDNPPQDWEPCPDCFREWYSEERSDGYTFRSIRFVQAVQDRQDQGEIEIYFRQVVDRVDSRNIFMWREKKQGDLF